MFRKVKYFDLEVKSGSLKRFRKLKIYAEAKASRFKLMSLQKGQRLLFFVFSYSSPRIGQLFRVWGYFGFGAPS